MQYRLRILASLGSSFAAILIASASHAVDGVIEINQAKALAGGVTASDTAGFPVTIDSKGSYRLTGDLTVPDEHTTGIRVEADDVTIDLNGFSIQGVTVCSGSPTTCSPTGDGQGIDAYFPIPRPINVTVMNGTVRGLGWDGVALGNNGRVSNVRALHNGWNGIYADYGSVVMNSTSSMNGFVGIACIATCLVTGNNLHANGEAGLYAQPSVAYAGNIITDNVATVIGSPVQIGTNLCNGSTTCP